MLAFRTKIAQRSEVISNMNLSEDWARVCGLLYNTNPTNKEQSIPINNYRPLFHSHGKKQSNPLSKRIRFRQQLVILNNRRFGAQAIETPGGNTQLKLKLQPAAYNSLLKFINYLQGYPGDSWQIKWANFLENPNR